MSHVTLFASLFICWFILRPFQRSYQLCKRVVPSNLSWKEPVLDSFHLRQTIKASPEDRTHAKDVTGLEI